MSSFVKHKIKLVQTPEFKVQIKTYHPEDFQDDNGHPCKSKILDKIGHLTEFILEAEFRLKKETGLNALKYIFASGTLIIKKADSSCGVVPIFNDLSEILVTE